MKTVISGWGLLKNNQTQQPKYLENSNIDIKSVTIEYPKTFHKFSKTIKHGKKVSQVVGAGRNFNSTLYSEITKREDFFHEKKKKKNAEMTKQSHAYQRYASSYNFNILNSFNPELQLKDT